MWRRALLSLILAAWIALLAFPTPVSVWASPFKAESPDIIINEIHYKPDPVTEWVEFVELHNPSPQGVNLAGWLLEGDIDYLLPANAMLRPGESLVIAQSPESFHAMYGWMPLGPFDGKLDNEGDHLILRDETSSVIDEVQYDHGFPWPTVGAMPGYSIQLLNPAADNAQPGAWRSAPPTPGESNAPLAVDLPPFIDQVTHRPSTPASGDAVTIRAHITDDDGIASATLLYQVVEPGSYIAIHDAAYHSNWTQVAMSPEDDDFWAVTLPPSLQQHRRLIRYRIYARDGSGNEIGVPYADDTQPNFAYFVYDGLPTWTASFDGNGTNPATFDFEQMAPLPVYHFIAKGQDVADALFLPPSGWTSGYMGRDYLWRGTLIYGDEVYDHVTFRARGGLTRYATGKTMWKINFHPGRRFQAYDDYGQPYPARWDKLNLGAIIQQTHRGYRGEQGMFESMGFRLFNLASVEGPTTHFAHLRVIDSAAETGASQYDGDFWGLYLAVEQMDGHFLDTHDLPDGNLYKMEIAGPDKNNQGASATTDYDDVYDFLHAYQTTWPDDSWWRENFDLARYYSYRAILEALHHYDLNEGKNYFYYQNPQSGIWSVHPWDLDLTWASTMPGTGEEPFLSTVLSRPAFQIEYQNRLKEVRDLLFNSDQMAPMLQEHARFIDSAANGLTAVDADRFRWDSSPVYTSRYVDLERTAPGKFYHAAESGDFAGMVALMAEWVETRGRWIDETLLTDVDHPYTPSLNYDGPAGYPADRLQFSTGDFRDPQGTDTFAALAWRLAEVTNPNGPIFDASAPWLYEIDTVAESGELTMLPSTWAIDPGMALPDHTYRVRVRTKDNSGRWSHWSAPHEFVAGEAVEPLASVTLTEIMYHPLPAGPRPGESFEFIELANNGVSPANLTNAYFSEGIEYHFAPGTVLMPGERLVLASNGAVFDAFYRNDFFDMASFGQYDKRLSNGGERLTLVDAYGRTLFSVAYDDNDSWPEAADGDGFSLVPIDEDGGAGADNWRASTAVCGSPGFADPLPVRINELLANPASGSSRLELFNPSDQTVDIGRWYLSDDPDQPLQYQLYPGISLQPGEHMELSAADMMAMPGAPSRLNLVTSGGQLVLSSADAAGRLTGYRHEISFGASESGISMGRLVTSDGQEFFVAQTEPSFGEQNPGSLAGPVVISEINYHPAVGDEFIELANISEQPVSLHGDEERWRIDGLLYEFPPGLMLEPGERLLLVPKSPSDMCLQKAFTDGRKVVGPYPRPLSDGGQSIVLVKEHSDGSGAIVVDQVVYKNAAPWPALAAGGGASLQRNDLTAFGSEPLNWHAVMQNGSLRSADAGTVIIELCAFEAFSAHENNSPAAVDINWVSYDEQNVAAFQLWRSPDGQRESAQLVNAEPIIAAGIDEGPAHYQVVDAAANTEEPNLTYWLEAIGASGEGVEAGYTRLRPAYYELFLPVVGQQQFTSTWTR